MKGRRLYDPNTVQDI